MEARLAVMSVRASPEALLQFKGEFVCAHRLQARAARRGTATRPENWWLLQEQKGRACTRGRERITARPLHEQVWGWDKAAAQLRLGSGTPHLANHPHSLWNCPFTARWRQLVPLMQAVCPRQAKASERLYDTEAEKRWARLPHREQGAGSFPRESGCTHFMQTGSSRSRLQAFTAHKHPANKQP